MKSLALRSTVIPAVVGAAIFLSAPVANASSLPVYSGPFYLNVDVASDYDISNIVEFTSGPEGSATGQFAISAPAGSVDNGFPFPGPSYDYTVFLVGIAHSDDAHDGGLALFTKTAYAPTAVGQSFNSLFSYDEATLANDLVNETVDGDARLNGFASAYIASIGFTPGDALSIIAFSDGALAGGGTSSVVPAPTPLPAALPLFATGLGAIGVFGWRRKRKTAAV